ncbi:MAG: hypothetical protein NTW14_13630 [bacterium]|nr:hypothetical protein [bacterium]
MQIILKIIYGSAVYLVTYLGICGYATDHSFPHISIHITCLVVSFGVVFSTKFSSPLHTTKAMLSLIQGNKFALEGIYSAAVKKYESGLSQNPRKSEECLLHYNKGVTFFKQDKKPDAKKELQIVLNLASELCENANKKIHQEGFTCLVNASEYLFLIYLLDRDTKLEERLTTGYKIHEKVIEISKISGKDREKELATIYTSLALIALTKNDVKKAEEYWLCRIQILLASEAQPTSRVKHTINYLMGLFNKPT